MTLLETVFDRVRKEDVVIWAGAGLSGYAGYPMAGKLATILFDVLSKAQQAEIDPRLALPEMAEYFVQLHNGNRAPLINLLLKYYSRKPTALTYHLLLSEIPHIKTIITTNYDQLFELAWKSKGYKILDLKDFVRKNNQTEIFKIHGDVTRPQEMLITRTDYNDFFKRDTLSSAYWSVLTERIASKTVVFMGYGNEDSNIYVLFERVWDEVARQGKQAIMICPGLAKHKVDDFKRRGIDYIDMKGEPFIEKLHLNVKKNIITDFHKGNVSAESLRAVLKQNDLVAHLASSSNDRYHLERLESTDNFTRTEAAFSFRDDPSMRKRLNDLIQGNDFGELTFSDENLRDFNVSYKGIDLVDKEERDYKFTISSVPRDNGEIDFVFDDGFELSHVSYTSFFSEIKIKLVFTYKFFMATGTALLKDNPDFHMDFAITQLTMIDTVKDGIDIFTFLKKLGSGERVTIYNRGNLDMVAVAFPETSTLIEDAKQYLGYVEVMKQIETNYKVRFRSISNLTYENLKALIKVDAYYNGRSQEFNWNDELLVILNQSALDYPEFISHLDNGRTLSQISQNREIIQVHGLQFDLGYERIEYLSPYIVNREDVISGKTKEAIIKSKTGRIKVAFTDTLP